LHRTQVQILIGFWICCTIKVILAYKLTTSEPIVKINETRCIYQLVGHHIKKGMITAIFNDNLEKIKLSINSSKYSLTAKALFRFYEKIKAIKIAIDKLDGKDELYTGKILLRSLFEHLIVSYYIWHKYISSKNDECAREYYEEYFMHEFFKQKGYKQKIQNIKTKTKKNINGLSFIKGLYPELDEVTEKQYQDINTVSNRFKIDNILSDLVNERPKENNIIILHEYMLGFLDEYNILSSFVHGGPFAEKEVFETENNLNYNTSKEWAKSALNAIQEYILLFLCDEDKIYLNILKPLIDKRNKELNNTVPNKV